MKYYIIAGEASGDLHASNLIKAIKKQDPAAQFRGYGGDLSKNAGLDLVQHYKEISFMGFYEVFRNLGTLRKSINNCKSDIASYKPDVVILVDFAGFNLRIAQFAKSIGIKTHYYISPKLWAWNASRVKKVKLYVDKMFCILPFETEFYAKYDVKVDYVGNPVVDAVLAHKANDNFRAENGLDERPIIAVLPGSRKQEIEHLLHFMVSIIPPFMQNYQFVIAGMNNLPQEYYEKFRRHDTIRVVYNQTYDLLKQASVAIVTSGTATLETAMFNVPQVVCYRTSEITYAIARSFIKVKFISLVNLIANKLIVKELIQDEFNPSNLSAELKLLLFNEEYRNTVLKGYAEIQQVLGKESASDKTATLIIKYLKA